VVCSTKKDVENTAEIYILVCCLCISNLCWKWL